MLPNLIVLDLLMVNLENSGLHALKNNPKTRFIPVFDLEHPPTKPRGIQMTMNRSENNDMRRISICVARRVSH